MKKSIIAALVLGVSVSSSALAESKFGFIPSVSYGLRTLSFDNTLGNQQGKFEDTFANLNLGAALTYDKFYAAISYDTSFLTNPVQSTVDQTDPITDIGRTDLSITGGYGYYSSGNHSLSAFAGYKHGETELEPEGSSYSDGYKLTYEEDGFFIGHSYSYYFESYGSLSLSVAYAWMDGSFSDNDASASQYKYDGDTAGFSLNAKWTGFIADKFYYSLSIVNHLYTFDGVVDPVAATNDPFLSRDVSFDESVITTSFGLSYYF